MAQRILHRALGFSLLAILAALLFGAIAWATGPLVAVGLIAGSIAFSLLLLLGLKLAFPL